jgi:hypothetical protein
MTSTPGRRHGDGDDLVVGLRRFSGDPGGSAQVFDADVVVVADDRGHLVAALVIILKLKKSCQSSFVYTSRLNNVVITELFHSAMTKMSEAVLLQK